MYDFILGAVVDFIFFERLSVLDTGQPVLCWSPLWHCLRSSWTWFSFCSQAFETFHSFPPPTTSPASIPRTLNSISFIRDTGELWESHPSLSVLACTHAQPPSPCSLQYGWPESPAWLRSILSSGRLLFSVFLRVNILFFQFPHTWCFFSLFSKHSILVILFSVSYCFSEHEGGAERDSGRVTWRERGICSQVSIHHSLALILPQKKSLSW